MSETIKSIIEWHEPDKMIGKKFNKLKVLDFIKTDKRVMPSGQIYKKEIYSCVCDCGRIIEVDGRNIVKGRAKSCGRCGYKKHGLNRTRIHRIWCNMKTRCYNKNCTKYKDYGGRGILVCNDWKNCFENFANWARENGYKDNLTLDRIDNDSGYCPMNCRWTTNAQQSRNQRTNNKYNGICISDWAKMLKVKRQTLSKYVQRNGWEKAIEHFNQNIPQTISDIIFWHSCFFSDATLEGQMQKWDDERLEWENTSTGTPDELYELADMVIVSCGIMRFDYAKGFNYLSVTLGKLYVTPLDGEKLWGAIEEKMKINRQRKWCIGNGNFQHIEE